MLPFSLNVLYFTTLDVALPISYAHFIARIDRSYEKELSKTSKKSHCCEYVANFHQMSYNARHFETLADIFVAILEQIKKSSENSYCSNCLAHFLPF